MEIAKFSQRYLKNIKPHMSFQIIGVLRSNMTDF